jgi:hypothetical protein
MILFLCLNCVVLFFLAITWGTKGWSNVFVKMILVALTLWNLVLVLQKTTLLNFLTT